MKMKIENSKIYYGQEQTQAAIAYVGTKYKKEFQLSNIQNTFKDGIICKCADITFLEQG